jgi:hypothetical protein
MLAPQMSCARAARRRYLLTGGRSLEEIVRRRIKWRRLTRKPWAPYVRTPGAKGLATRALPVVFQLWAGGPPLCQMGQSL